MNRFYILVASLLIAMIINCTQASTINRVYTSFFSMFYVDQWTEVAVKDLPMGYSDPASFIRQKNWVSGMRLNGSNDLVLFVFSKPTINSTGDFCRSRLDIEIFYNYDARKTIRELPSTSLMNFMELVKFSELDTALDCKANRLEDLDGYIIVVSPMRDDDLLQLWDIFEENKHCLKWGSPILKKIGISPFANQSKDNGYYFEIGTQEGHVGIEFGSDQLTSNELCNQFRNVGIMSD